MRILATLDDPTAGTAFLDGVSILDDPEVARRSVGYMPDSLPVHRDVTAGEYLDFFARAYGLRQPGRGRVVAGVEEFTGLGPLRETPIAALSKGMKQRVSLARALIHDPSVLILDEPAAGLDPRARVELRELLRLLAGQGKAILISSHILAELSEISDGAIILEAGKIVRAGAVVDSLLDAVLLTVRIRLLPASGGLARRVGARAPRDSGGRGGARGRAEARGRSRRRRGRRGRSAGRDRRARSSGGRVQPAPERAGRGVSPPDRKALRVSTIGAGGLSRPLRTASGVPRRSSQSDRGQRAPPGGARGKVLASLLLLLLLLQLVHLGVLLLFQGAVETPSVSGGPGGVVAMGIVGYLLFVLIVVLPFIVALRLHFERSGDGMDLVFVSTLEPRRIIHGKLLSGLVVTVLLVSVVAPFLSFTYFLRGVDLPSIALALGGGIVVSVCALELGIFAGCLPAGRLARVLLALTLSSACSPFCSR